MSVISTPHLTGILCEFNSEFTNAALTQLTLCTEMFNVILDAMCLFRLHA